MRKWLAGSLVFLALALLFRMSLLVLAMYALVLLLVVSRHLARVWSEGLSATRHCGATKLQVGDSAEIALEIRNAGGLGVTWVLAEDILPRSALASRPPKITVDGRRIKLLSLGRRASKLLKYQIQFAMRGYYQIGPLVLETGDLFGLHRRYKVVTEPNFVLVYPEVVPLAGYDLSSRRPIGEVRLAHRLYEDPTRTAGSRLYQPGDPLNRVDWKASARSGRLHSRVFEPSTVVGATIVLDLHSASFPAGNEPVRSELAITAAASVAGAIYELGQQVGLVTNGRDAVDRIATSGWDHPLKNRDTARATGSMRESSERLSPVIVPTRKGAEQLERILVALARLELTDGLDFGQLVIHEAHRLPRDATVLAILGDVTDEIALALGHLRRRGYAVSAVLINFDSYESQRAAGRLLSQGIESKVARDRETLAVMCQEQLIHSWVGGYSLS